jgi:hypothetical protein
MMTARRAFASSTVWWSRPDRRSPDRVDVEQRGALVRERLRVAIEAVAEVEPGHLEVVRDGRDERRPLERAIVKRSPGSPSVGSPDGCEM